MALSTNRFLFWFAIILFEFKTFHATTCPCVPIFPKDKTETFKSCGWQINEGGGSDCNDNDIYEGCKSENKTSEPAKVSKTCPNECFYKEPNKLTCGVCGKWGANGLCSKITKETDKKETFGKNHKSRPKMNEKPDIKVTRVYGPNIDTSDVLYDEGGLLTDDWGSQCEFELSFEDDFQLELVFVMDARSDYNIESSSVKSFLRIFQENVKAIVSGLENLFPTSRFGVTSFVDWFERTNCKEDYCYQCNCNLEDWDKFHGGLASCIHDIENGIGGDRPQSSLTALYYTALDKTVHWSDTVYNDKGQRIVKFMVFLTNGPWISHEWLQQSGQADDPVKKFKLPKGNGEDDCDGVGPPKIEDVRRVINDKEFFLIGLIGHEVWIEDWKKYIKLLRATKTSYLSIVETGASQRQRDIPIIIDILIHHIKSLLCKKFVPEPFNIQGI